jgi:type IV pilus assembly protein PilW
VIKRHRGVTLIELMIAMLLGLVVIGGALGVILANRQSYRTNEGLSQVQESARTAFELLARDVRQAGVTGCDSNGRVANVVRTNAATAWWQEWFGIRGFDGTEPDAAVGFGSALPDNRVEGTDSIHLQGIEGVGVSVVSHDAPSATFEINAPTTALARDDVVLVCDFNHAAILKITSYDNSGTSVVHDSGPPGEPIHNCSMGLGYPTDCDSTTGNPYEYGPNAQIARLATVDWYIGDNGRPLEGGRSLYRRRMMANPEELVAGVIDMQVRYREGTRDDFREAALVESWPDVNAVMITLVLQSADRRVSTDATVNAGRLQREFTNIVTLRNRVP